MDSESRHVLLEEEELVVSGVAETQPLLWQRWERTTRWWPRAGRKL